MSVLTPTMPAPITASYRLADLTPVFTEPRAIKFTTTGIEFTFTFHHAGNPVTVREVEITLVGVTKRIRLTVDSTLMNGDSFNVTYNLPYG